MKVDKYSVNERQINYWAYFDFSKRAMLTSHAVGPRNVGPDGEFLRMRMEKMAATGFSKKSSQTLNPSTFFEIAIGIYFEFECFLRIFSFFFSYPIVIDISFIFYIE